MVSLTSTESVLELGGRDVAEVTMKPSGVVPMHPAENRELEILDARQRSWACVSAGKFGLVIAVDRLGEGVVV